MTLSHLSKMVVVGKAAEDGIINLEVDDLIAGDEDDNLTVFSQCLTAPKRF